jgi:hypothetical protein
LIALASRLRRVHEEQHDVFRPLPELESWRLVTEDVFVEPRLFACGPIRGKADVRVS